jgi:hypothetical protein
VASLADVPLSTAWASTTAGVAVRALPLLESSCEALPMASLAMTLADVSVSMTVSPSTRVTAKSVSMTVSPSALLAVESVSMTVSPSTLLADVKCLDDGQPVHSRHSKGRLDDGQPVWSPCCRRVSR